MRKMTKFLSMSMNDQLICFRISDPDYHDYNSHEVHMVKKPVLEESHTLHSYSKYTSPHHPLGSPVRKLTSRDLNRDEESLMCNIKRKIEFPLS